ILELTDPLDPSFKYGSLYDTVRLGSYQLRLQATAARYFPAGKNGVVKTGIQGGLLQGSSLFRNELFQIGGYRTLRGFDEESQFVSHYAIGTLEYRYLFGINSFFFAFFDGGLGRHATEAVKGHQYLGTGLGLALETKAGIFNLAWAIGKRDDAALNLRGSKVHLGFVNYF
ncbi:MAG TPA: hypothetical protein VHK69_01875, partial [Chitinophagaceae bacterium]|nr:hypothetical protein [Chitinophagaceae bacterium]